MAKFSGLGAGATRALGEWITKLAARVAASGLDSVKEAGITPARLETTRESDFQSLVSDTLVFDPSISHAEDQKARATAALNSANGTDKVYVQLHFDRQVMLNNGEVGRIVNVCVPNFDSKIVRDANNNPVLDGDGEPAVDLRKAAEEAFGSVVIYSCELVEPPNK